jgi:membrane protease YdiL (CAAX protease family)
VTRWVAFAALTAVVTVVVLFSARASAARIDELVEPTPTANALDDGAGHLEGIGVAKSASASDSDVASASAGVPRTAILANAAASQGFFGAVLVLGVVLADVPASALGVGPGTFSGWDALLGIAVGGALAALNALVGSVADAFGVDPSRALRELLSPGSRREGAMLFGLVLPVVAGFEELLFRGILVGAFAVGSGLPALLLAVGSSVLFAAGHGAQGRVGIAATGLLGLALAAAFVSTGSLLVVVVAHYLVNAAEFALAEREVGPFG